MANEEHLKILKQGVKVWNKWREDNSEIIPDLSQIELIGLKAEGIDLKRADLTDTLIVSGDFSNASLLRAEFVRTKLTMVSMIEANLSSSNFFYAYLVGCNLEKANLSAALSGTIFKDVNLKDADFNKAVLSGNMFSNIDLSQTKGLDNISDIFSGPSTIGIDTLYLSAGKIPESFLRICGIPDDFITFIPSHFGIQQAIQFYSCFISYSTKDEEFARRLYSRMRDEKLRVWFAPEDIKGGEKLHEQIERAIQLHDRLLIILSEESMASEWVMSEIRNARKTEIEQNRRKLFPIRLTDFETIKKWKCFDGDSGKDLAVELREYYIPDFSDWKDHDSFETEFAKLLRDLKAEEEKQAQQRS